MTDFNKENDLATLLSLMAVIGSQAFIEGQEAAGQSDLIHSTALPKDGDWSTLERWGIVKGAEIDDLFIQATLPQGWQKVATDHSMHSNLIDDRGLVRAVIFYKAAFYDRSAFITVNKSRFEIRPDYKNRNKVAFNVCDKGLNIVAKHCEGAQYALCQDVLGCYFKGVFYHEIEGQEPKCCFTGSGIPTDDVTIISLDSFYKDYHHKTPRHDLMEATEDLARTEALEFYESLPSDDSQWSSEYDFQAQ